MKRNLTRKLILSVSALACTAVCLSSTTYAWFAKNKIAWTDEFQIRLYTEEGLQISVDGENYFDSITKAQLTKALAVERYNAANPDNTKTYATISDEEVTAWGTTSLSPVSPDSNWNFWGFNTTDNLEDNQDKYFDSVNKLYVPVNLTEANKTKSYLKFDLYFRAIPSSKSPKERYNLVFADQATAEGMGVTRITGQPSTVKLYNKLNVLESKDTRENPETRGLYKALDEITINPADAMRIAVIGDNNSTTVYEPNEGLGSTAYEGAAEGLNDPQTNPMVTYFNNTHSKGNLKLLHNISDKVETKKNFEDKISFGTFVKKDDGTYNNLKATFYIWLDGYDADYLEGVNTDSISFFLNFTKVEG